jgi:hypothetical protein
MQIRKVAYEKKIIGLRLFFFSSVPQIRQQREFLRKRLAGMVGEDERDLQVYLLDDSSLLAVILCHDVRCRA